MVGEASADEWTLRSTREHLLALIAELDRRNVQQFEAQEKAVAAALAAADRAVAKAELASERRFDSVNEFRATLSDQASRFVTRDEIDARLAPLVEKVNAALSNSSATSQRSAGLNAGWMILVQMAAVAAAVVAVVVAVTR